MVDRTQQDELNVTAMVRARWLRRALAGFGLLLLSVTWRLWTPQSIFPQAPLWEAAVAAPAWCDWIGLFAMVASLANMLLARQASRTWRVSCLVFAAATSLMVLVDQHRLQPWAYQFAVLCVVLATCPDRWSVRLIRALTISIYFFSALSKLDHTFLFTLGQQLLSTGLQWLGISAQSWPNAARVTGALAFPVGELTVAVLLMFRGTRRVGLAGAITMHSLLILLLGPFGLGHRAGVLIWNGFFIVQDWILFGRRRESLHAPPTSANSQPCTRWPSPALRFCGVLVGCTAMLLPALEPLGRWDHWPAWAVYAPQGGYITLLVSDTASDNLPVEVRQFLTAPREDTTWRTLRIDRWSLAALGVPIYPEERFQLAVALDVIDRYNLDGQAHVVLHSSAARTTGVRNKVVLADRAAIENAATGFTLGARARVK